MSDTVYGQRNKERKKKTHTQGHYGIEVASTYQCKNEKNGNIRIIKAVTQTHPGIKISSSEISLLH